MVESNLKCVLAIFETNKRFDKFQQFFPRLISSLIFIGTYNLNKIIISKCGGLSLNKLFADPLQNGVC